MSKPSKTKKLALHRETLRALNNTELRFVAGGRPNNHNNCTRRLSGCL